MVKKGSKEEELFDGKRGLGNLSRQSIITRMVSALWTQMSVRNSPVVAQLSSRMDRKNERGYYETKSQHMQRISTTEGNNPTYNTLIRTRCIFSFFLY